MNFGSKCFCELGEVGLRGLLKPPLITFLEALHTSWFFENLAPARRRMP